MTNTPPTDELITVREFAQRLGYKPHYGSELKKTGRLVMADDGKHCHYQASLERFNASRDPSKAGVAARHAAKRAAAAAPEVANPPPPPPTTPEEAEGEAPSLPQYDFQNAKAKREHWAAEREYIAFMREAGELIDLAEHRAALADLGATVRTKLEAWAPTLAPQLAGQDEAAVRTTLADQVEHFLRELVASVRSHSKEPEASADSPESPSP